MTFLDAFDRRDLKHRALALRDQADDLRNHGGDIVSRAIADLQKAAVPALHRAADVAGHEGKALAAYAGRRAQRAGRMVRADPMPALVGVVGLALVATVLLSHRRRASRS